MSSFCWEEDDLGVQKELKRLWNVFEDEFKVTTIFGFSILSKAPFTKLEERLVTMKRLRSHPDNPLIVCYGGHGGYNDDGRLTWSPFKYVHSTQVVPVEELRQK
jgi:hypothetical protein